MTMRDDLARRERAIQWPAKFDPDRADMFVHNSLLIDARPEKIWSHIVDVAKWPDWYLNAKDVALLRGAKELGADVRWRWTTFGISGESWVTEFSPHRRISWSGDGPGKDLSFYHTWYLEPIDRACRVTTEEAAIGKDAAELRHADEGLMHRGHHLWLAGLKWISEGE